MAEMAQVVNRHPTAINHHLARLQRFKLFGAIAQAVGKAQGHNWSGAQDEATACSAALISLRFSSSQRRSVPPALAWPPGRPVPHRYQLFVYLEQLLGW